MFGLFKKNKCQHYKGFGDPSLDNMVILIKFSPYKKGTMPFSVSECTECGKRVFGCLYLHCMGLGVSEKVDEFIRYEITIEELVDIFDEHKYRYALTASIAHIKETENI